MFLSRTSPTQYKVMSQKSALATPPPVPPNEKAVKRRKTQRILVHSNGTITTPTATALDGIDDAAHPVLQEVGDVADGVAVG